MTPWRGRGLFTALPELSEKRVPPSALLISVVALAVAAAGNFLWPERLPDVFALLWLLALIPPFLLAYYKGWAGAALALGAGMVLLIGVEVGGSHLADREIRWWVVSAVIVVLIGVSLGAGAITDRLHRRASDALDLAFSDPLTGLPNRRVLDLFLQKAFSAAERGGELSVVLFDLDGLKQLNDTRGHSAGDDALRTVARVLAANTRASDVSGRLGGDEFLTILPGAPASSALAFAQRVSEELETAAGDRPDGIGLSTGIASHRPGMPGVQALIDAADDALYTAKESGRGRAVIAPSARAEATRTVPVRTPIEA